MTVMSARRLRTALGNVGKDLRRLGAQALDASADIVPSEPESSMTTTEPVPRGRPRSTGGHKCARCGRMAAKIQARWPEGAICGICFTTALHTIGTCRTSFCLPSRAAPARSRRRAEC